MRLLLVEDYEPIREAVSQGLREEGFYVDVAADGPTGLWHATSNDYDAVILDLMLPGLDGLSLLKQMRAKGSQAHVLILTARDATDDRVRGLDLGADDYLVKPFAFKELLARVRALVRRRYAAKNPLLTIDDLELDTTARMVRRSGKRVDLSPREYALLELLAIRKGEVVTRSDIWEHIYELHSSAESNVVEVLIGHLRKKLETTGVKKLIHTRRGHGYVLEASPD